MKTYSDSEELNRAEFREGRCHNAAAGLILTTNGASEFQIQSLTLPSLSCLQFWNEKEVFTEPLHRCAWPHYMSGHNLQRPVKFPAFTLWLEGNMFGKCAKHKKNHIHGMKSSIIKKILPSCCCKGVHYVLTDSTPSWCWLIWGLCCQPRWQPQFTAAGAAWLQWNWVRDI